MLWGCLLDMIMIMIMQWQAYKEVLLAYGRYTGGNTVYNDLPSNGARVIVLKEGERKFNTYIRIANGEIESFVSYPDNFF